VLAPLGRQVAWLSLEAPRRQPRGPWEIRRLDGVVDHLLDQAGAFKPITRSTVQPANLVRAF